IWRAELDPSRRGVAGRAPGKQPSVAAGVGALAGRFVREDFVAVDADTLAAGDGLAADAGPDVADELAAGAFAAGVHGGAGGIGFAGAVVQDGGAGGVGRAGVAVGDAVAAADAGAVVGAGGGAGATDALA